MQKLAHIACALLLATAPARSQGFADLGADAEGFATVTPPAELSFPRDHGPHPDFRIEWWYLTANLTDAEGTPYGVQWTLFRQALAPGADAPGWDNGQIWMAHAAATSASEHVFAETFARGGVGQAEVRATPFTARIDDWSMTAPDAAAAGADALAALTLAAAGDAFAYDLSLAADLPPVPQGIDGFSRKSERGQASYYYSQPFFRVDGSLTLNGRTIAVTGQGWLDREWSSQPLDADQDGWDWFALHLDDGRKLMLFRLRSESDPAYLAGTLIDASGHPTPLPPGALTATPGETTRVAGRKIPTTWQIALPEHGITLDLDALNPASWMATRFGYWEGPVRIAGSHTGVGYLEMTGYD